MATKNRSVSELSGRNKKFYDLLMQYREMVTNQMKYHVEDALNSDNTDKRGVTTHMADMGSDTFDTTSSPIRNDSFSDAEGT